MLLPSTKSSTVPNSRMLYQIACTMCSTCCGSFPVTSPPPPPPPPPPSLATTFNCPPPPSPPASPGGGSYYSPPPPPPPPPFHLHLLFTATSTRRCHGRALITLHQITRTILHPHLLTRLSHTSLSTIIAPHLLIPRLLLSS
ncbi:hypothetical protein NC653_022148 [Populus alba x Populus x berolinensis]|nr:hypothetical protein NC653_022148 [Populus alba x Populus x berolinensis]